jgi:serine/threonine protein kinase
MTNHDGIELACEEVAVEIRLPPNVVTECTENFTLERRIGRGSQGEVWHAEALATGRFFAVKLLTMSADALSELRAHRHLKRYEPHVNILHLEWSYMDR